MILFITLATFSQTGGVQMVCRSMTKALDNISIQDSEAFQMISLCDAAADLDVNYVSANAFKAFQHQRLPFCVYAIKKAFSSRRVILAHSNLLLLACLISMLSPKTKMILLAHGKEVWGKMSWWKKALLNRKLEVWAVSSFTKRVLQEKHKIIPGRIKVLNNCLDPFFQVPVQFNKPEYLLKRYHLTKNEQVLLTLTRLDEFERNKGFDLVLDCLPSLLPSYPRIRYLIAGKATEAEHQRLQVKIQALNLQKHVVLTGFVPLRELTDHHLLADIFVLPSSKEGFGLVFLEAAACGSNIIAGNQDGSVDAVMDGELGLLVNPHSAHEISAALKELLMKPRDPIARKRQQRISTTNFSFDNYQQAIHSLLISAQ
jgi:glycosyltransferase involved in cell wall biosynthesis